MPLALLPLANLLWYVFSSPTVQNTVRCSFTYHFSSPFHNFALLSTTILSNSTLKLCLEQLILPFCLCFFILRDQLVRNQCLYCKKWYTFCLFTAFGTFAHKNQKPQRLAEAFEIIPAETYFPGSSPIEYFRH